MNNLQKGFTLIELMIVVAIIGILAAVAIPSYQQYTLKAKFSEVVLATAPYKTAIEVCAQEQGTYTAAACGVSGTNGVPASGGASAYVTSVAAAGGVITATGTAAVGSYTYTLTASDGGNGKVAWAIDGTCKTRTAGSIC